MDSKQRRSLPRNLTYGLDASHRSGLPGQARRGWMFMCVPARVRPRAADDSEPIAASGVGRQIARIRGLAERQVHPDPARAGLGVIRGVAARRLHEAARRLHAALLTPFQGLSHIVRAACVRAHFEVARRLHVMKTMV